MCTKEHNFDRTFALAFGAEFVNKTEIAYTIVTAVCVRTFAINTASFRVRVNRTLIYV